MSDEKKKHEETEEGRAGCGRGVEAINMNFSAFFVLLREAFNGISVLLEIKKRVKKK